MAKWIKQPCVELLKKINEVPQDADRESRQLAILMEGISNLNKETMRRAAESARAQLGDIAQAKKAPEQKTTPEPKEDVKEALNDTPDLDDFDSFDEELDMIEQTLIRSIGD